jgi:hypothetical protein
MLACDTRLMPDQPGQGPPSSPPLSVEDADRLAESFTPFWEDEDVAAPTAAPDPVAAPGGASAQPTGPAEAVKAPAATLPIVKKSVGKQTLLGLAPIVATPGVALAPMPAAAAEGTPPFTTTQPLPAVAAAPNATAPTAPVPGPTAGNPHKKTLLGFSAPQAQPPAPIPAPAPAAAAPIAAAPAAAASTDLVATPIVQSAANVPGYAVAYTPKDGPATPAVVIAPEAQSSPEAVERPLSVTRRSKVRAVPSPEAPAPVAALDDIDEAYPAKKKTGMFVAASIGGVVLLLGIALGMRALGRGATSSTGAAAPEATPTAAPVLTVPAQAAPENNVAAPAAAAPVVAAPTAEPTPPAAVAPAIATREPSSPPATEPRAKVAKPKPKSVPVAAPTPRPAPRPVATATFPSEPSPPAPKATAGKSVIVRDAPF